jgi:hypothetical protein
MHSELGGRDVARGLPQQMVVKPSREPVRSECFGLPIRGLSLTIWLCISRAHFPALRYLYPTTVSYHTSKVRGHTMCPTTGVSGAPLKQLPSDHPIRRIKTLHGGNPPSLSVVPRREGIPILRTVPMGRHLPVAAEMLSRKG